MSLLGFLGLDNRRAGEGSAPESLEAIAARLEGLPADEARFAAAFAYLLARIAGSDLRIDEEERREMARHLTTFAGIDSERASLLSETAVQAARTYSASDDHLVARAFREMSDRSDRLRLVRCLYAVAAADQTISTREDNAIFDVATSIQVERDDVVAIRAEFRSHLGTLRALSGER